MKLFEKEDIVYFKEEYTSTYTYGLHFHKTNQPYKVIDLFPIFSKKHPIILNINTGEKFFVDVQMINYLITESEWKLLNRQKNINDLLQSDSSIEKKLTLIELSKN